MSNYYRKDWILFEEIGNEGGRIPEALIPVKIKEGDPETNAHVPFIEETQEGYIVKTGKNKYHGNDAEHHMIYLEIVVDKAMKHRKHLKFGETPEVHFKVEKGTHVQAFAFCNLHGLHTHTLKK